MPSDELRRVGTRLRSARRERGLSLEDAASATGVSASFLSHVENGKNDVSFTRLRRLVDFYGLSLMDLAAPRPLDSRIVRVEEREELHLDEYVSVYLLAPDDNRNMVPIMCVWERGAGGTPPEPIRLESEEFLHVLQGSLEIAFEDGETVRLRAGDSIYLIEPNRSRTYRNVGRGRTVTLSTLSPAMPLPFSGRQLPAAS